MLSEVTIAMSDQFPVFERGLEHFQPADRLGDSTMFSVHLSLTVKTRPQTRRSGLHPEGDRSTPLTIEAAKKRLHHNVLAIALANKLARIAWALLNKGRAFECVKTEEMTSRPA